MTNIFSRFVHNPRKKLGVVLSLAVILNQIVPFINISASPVSAAVQTTKWERDNNAANTATYYAISPSSASMELTSVSGLVDLTDTGLATALAGTASLNTGARNIQALEVLRCDYGSLENVYDSNNVLYAQRCPAGSENMGTGAFSGTMATWPASGSINLAKNQVLSVRMTFQPNANLASGTILRNYSKWTYSYTGYTNQHANTDGEQYQFFAANLTINKGDGTLLTDKDGTGTITAGDVVRFPVSITNNTTGAQGSAYTCTLVDWPETGKFVEGSTTRTIGNIAPGATVNQNFDMTIAAGATGTLNNKAGVTCYNIDNIPGGPTTETVGGTKYYTDTGIVNVVAAPTYSLSITKNDSVGDAKNQTKTVGQTVDPWTVTVKNAGTGTLTNVTLTDSVPNLVNAVSYSGDYSGSNNNISIPVGTLTAGQTKTITVSGTANTAGNATNTATATATETSPVSDSANISVNPAPTFNLVVTKNDSVGDAKNQTKTVGQTVDPWTVTVKNAGTGTLTNVTLTDSVPNFVNAVSYSGDYSGSNNNISIPVGTLTAGQTKTITVSGTANTAGNATNTATATATETSPVSDTANITVNAAPPQVGNVKVEVYQDDNNDNMISQGDTFYTASNLSVNVNGLSSPVSIVNGKGTAANVALGTYTYQNMGGLAANYSDITGICGTTGGCIPSVTIANGQTQTLILLVKNTPVLPTLSITKTPANQTVTFKDNVSWNITVNNTSTVTANNVVLNDDVPSQISNVAVTGTGCSVTGNSVICNFGSMNAGTSHTITVTGKASVAQDSTNVARTHADQVSEIQATANVHVLIPILAITKTTSTPEVFLNDAIQFTITLTNNGLGLAHNVVLTDTIPSQFTNTNYSGACSGTGNAISCNFGDVNPNSSRTVTVTGNASTAGATHNDSYTNTATAVADNNGTVTASASIIVDNPQLSIVKTVSNNGQCPGIATDVNNPFNIIQGSTVTYCYQVTNPGNVTLTNVLVNDDKLGNIGTIASLAAGASQPLSKSQTMNVSPQVIKNVVTATTTFTIPGTSNARNLSATDKAFVCVTVSPAPSITVVKTVAVGSVSSCPLDANGQLVKQVHVDSGTAVTYCYTVTNNGNVPLTNVSVIDDQLGNLDSAPTFNLTNGAFKSYTKVKLNVTADIYNIVTATGSYASITKTATDSANVYVNHYVPSLSFNKTAQFAGGKTGTPDALHPAYPGDTVLYTLTVSETTGKADYSNFDFSDDISNILKYANVTAISPTGTVAGTTISWGSGTITAGQTMTETFKVVVNPSNTWVGCGTSCTSSFVMTNNFHGVTVNVPLRDLVIVKTVVNPTVLSGDNAIWKITATEIGNMGMGGAQIKDTFPVGTTYAMLGQIVTPNISLSESLDAAHNTVTWTVAPSTYSGQSVSFFFATKVNASQPPVVQTNGLQNCAVVADDGYTSNQSCAKVGVGTRLTGNITKQVEGQSSDQIEMDTVHAKVLNYAVTVTNNSSSNVAGDKVIVTDNLPQDSNGQVFSYVDGSTVAKVGSTTVICATNVSGQSVTWTCGTPSFLPAGATLTINYQVSVPAAIANNLTVGYTNTATATISTSTVTKSVGSASAVVYVSHFVPNLSFNKTATLPNSTIIAGADHPLYPYYPVQYTLTVTETTGKADYPNFVFSDDIGGVLQFAHILSISDNGTVNGNTISWGTKTIPAGQTITESFVVVINTSDTWPVCSISTGVGAGLNCTSNYVMTNSFQGKTVNVPVRDIVITKTAVNPLVMPGDNAIWKISVTEIGSVGLGGLLISDLLPANTSYGGLGQIVTSGVSLAETVKHDTTVEWVVQPSNFSGHNVTFYFGTKVSASQPPGTGSHGLQNCASTVVIDGSDVHAIPGVSCAWVDVGTRLSGKINKLVEGTSSYQMDTDTVHAKVLNYSVTVTNNSTSNVAGDKVIVTDNLPQDSNGHVFSYVDGSTVAKVGSTTVICATNVSGQSVTWTCGTPSFLPAGSSLTINYPVNVPAAIAESLTTGYTNTATASINDKLIGSSSAVVYVSSPRVDVKVTKDDGVTTLLPGASTTYTLAITNDGSNGTTTALGVVLTDTLPAASLLDTATATSITLGTHSYPVVSNTNGQILWSAFDLPLGQTATAQVTIKLKSSVTAGTSIDNLADVINASPRDVNPANNHAVDSDIVVDSDMWINKFVSSSPSWSTNSGSALVSAGDTAYYQIKVGNSGTAPETGAVTDLMSINGNPDVSVFDSITVSGPNNYTHTYTQPIPNPIVLSSTGNVNFAPGSSITYTLTAKVKADMLQSGTTIVNNMAQVAYGSKVKQSSAVLNINANPNIVLHKYAWIETPDREMDPETNPANPGDWIKYTLTATNTGSAPMHGFIFSDNISQVMDDVNSPWTESENVKLGEGVIQGSGSELTLVKGNNPDIAPGQTISYIFYVKAGDIQTNHDNTMTNTYGDTITVKIVSPDVRVTKVVDSQTTSFGQQIKFTITATNYGNHTANNVAIVDFLPQDASGPLFTYAGVTSGITQQHPTGPCAWDKVNQSYSCTALDPAKTVELWWTKDNYGHAINLAPNQSQQIQIVFNALVNVNPTVATSYINRAQAKFIGGQSNIAEATVMVEPLPTTSLSILKSPSNQTVESLSETDWTIKVNNNGGRDETNVFVKDVLPPGFTAMMEQIGNSQVVKRAEITIKDGSGNVTSQLLMTPVSSYNSSYNSTTYVWPNNNDGFKLVKGGSIIISIGAKAPSVKTDTQFTNTAQVLIGAELQDTSTAIVNVNAVKAANVQITKDVKEGKIASGNAWTKTLLLDHTSNDTWVTYRVVVSNPGQLGETVNLSDVVDFTSPQRIYDQLKVYKHTNTGDVLTATYFASTYHDSTIALVQGLLVPAGSSDATNPANMCTGCTYLIEAQIRPSFYQNETSNENIARALQTRTLNVLAEDKAVVKVSLTPSLQVTKYVRNLTTNSGWVVDNVTAAPGDQLQYKIEVINNGYVAIPSVNVTDTLQGRDTYFTNIGVNNADSDADGKAFVGSWDNMTLTNLDVGQTESFTIQAVVKSPFPGNSMSLTNQVWANNVPSNIVKVNVVLSPKPAIKKYVSLDGKNFFDKVNAIPGATVEYKVLVWNEGNGDLSLTVNDVLDATQYASIGVLNQDADNNGTKYIGTDYQTQQITVKAGTSENNAEVFTLDAVLKADGFKEGDLVKNVASFTFQNQEYHGETTITIHVPLSNLVLSKSAFNTTQNKDAQSSTAQAGDIVTYTLKVSNSGDGTAVNYKFMDEISNVLTYADFKTASDGGTLVNNSVVWPTIGTINAGSSASRTFQVQVKNPLPTTGNFIMSNVFGNQTQVPVGSIELHKAVSFVDGGAVNRALRAGDQLVYTLTAINHSSNVAPGFVFTDDVSNLTRYAGNFSKVVTTDPAFTTTDVNQDGVIEKISWAAADLAANATVTRRFEVTVKDFSTWPANGDLTMTNTYGDTTTVKLINLSLTKVASPTQVNSTDSDTNRVITYTLTLKNSTAQNATNLFITDLLPAGFTYAGQAQINGQAAVPQQSTVNGRVYLVWQGVNLAANTTAIVTYTTLAPAAAGSYTNLASLTDIQGSPFDTAHATVTVVTPPTQPTPNPLLISKAANVTTVVHGNNVSYTVSVSNNGNAAITFTLQDILPPGFAYVAGSANVAGTAAEPQVNTTASSITWSGLNLAAGHNIIVTYQTKSANLAGYYTNIATATSGSWTASASATVMVTVPQVLSATTTAPFVSVLAGTGTNLSVVILIVLAVIAAYGLFLVLKKRKSSVK